MLIARGLEMVRRWWWVGVVYVALGLVVSVGLAWWAGRRLVNVRDEWWAAEAVERGGAHLCVEASGSWGAEFVSFSGCWDRRSAEIQVDAAELERYRLLYGPGERMPAKESLTTPRWAWRVLDDSLRGFGARPAGQADRVGVAAAGWPLPCVMSAEIWIVGALPRAVGVWTFRPGLGLPYVPLWAGLIVDVLVFASVPAVLHAGVRGLVRGRRRARGECVACGYPRVGLGAGAGCPECGAGGGSVRGEPQA